MKKSISIILVSLLFATILVGAFRATPAEAAKKKCTKHSYIISYKCTNKTHQKISTCKKCKKITKGKPVAHTRTRLISKLDKTHYLYYCGVCKKAFKTRGKWMLS